MLEERLLKLRRNVSFSVIKSKPFKTVELFIASLLRIAGNPLTRINGTKLSRIK
jgi:hypothetical protein